MTTTNKTVALITGANQGIGLAIATRLALSHDYHVILASRSLPAGLSAAASLTARGASASAVQLDLTSDASIAALVTHLTTTYGHLDVLVNNAGILLDSKPHGLTPRELYATTFDTNATGPALLTTALLPLLRASAQRPRVVFVSSRMGSIAVSGDASTPWYGIDYRAYDASKAAVNMLAVNVVRDLREKGAYVNVVCPGLVKTALTGWMEAGAEPEVGAQRAVEMATLSGRETEVSGTFSDKDGSILW